jgi:hypothetical protein
MATTQEIAELRLRVEGSFTGTELRQLAQKWGLVPEPTWDRSPTHLVRGLVAQADRMFGSAELVRRLRAERPLVEWPDFESDEAAKWGPRAPVSPAVSEEATLVGAPPEAAPDPTLADLGELELPEADATVVEDEGREPPVALEPGPPPSARADAPVPSQRAAAPSPAPDAGPPSSAARPPTSRAPFPGTFQDAGASSPRAREGIDPKVLVVVAGLMLALAVVAFGAGLFWSRRGPSTEAPKAGAAPRPNAVASRASSVLDAALLGVATRCEVDVDGAPGAEILATAQEGCGRATREAKRRALNDRATPAPLDPSLPRPRADANDDDRRPSRPSTGGGAPERPTCLSRCAGVKGDCMSACGEEPSDASKFDVWQACSGRCLASESRCRLSCR